MKATFVVDGLPVAKARPRLTRTGHAYTPAKTRAYELRISQMFRAKYVMLPRNKPVMLSVIARFPIPNYAKRKTKLDKILEGEIYGHRPDMDNIMKSVLDGLNGVAYTDDALVYCLYGRKEYSKYPGVTVTLEWED